jgi:uncharacterized protein YndB with AHSA1/START domain
MDRLYLTQVPVAQTGMLIRKPVGIVFNAFIDPAITTKFWFTRSSGRLETGKRIRWEWEMYTASADVVVKMLEKDRLIVLEWGEPGAFTTVEFVFTARTDDTTFVNITNAGFSGEGDKVNNQAMDSVAGFSLVLAGLKAYLEHGIELNLIADRFPDLLVNRPEAMGPSNHRVDK